MHDVPVTGLPLLRDGLTDKEIEGLLAGTLDPASLASPQPGEPLVLSPEQVEALPGSPISPTAAPPDEVYKPAHYKLPGSREALADVIGPVCDALAERGLRGHVIYMIGSALKYLTRVGAKGAAAQDLRKAAEYLARAIESLEDV